MAGPIVYDGKVTPKDIYDLCIAAKAYADDNSNGYTITPGNKGTNCQTMVNQVTSKVGMGDYPHIYMGGYSVNKYWKVYNYGGQPKGELWPGDIISILGKHIAIVVDWHGHTAEALNSGPDPYGDLNGSEYGCGELAVVTKKTSITKEREGETGSGTKVASSEADISKASPSDQYLLSKSKNSKLKETSTGWMRHSYYDTYYNGLGIKISWEKYQELYQAGKPCSYKRTYIYRNTTVTYYGYEYMPGSDGTDHMIFRATPGDQTGEEVVSNGSAYGREWNLLARRVASWGGIDHFIGPDTGGAIVYEIPV